MRHVAVVVFHAATWMACNLGFYTENTPLRPSSFDESMKMNNDEHPIKEMLNLTHSLNPDLAPEFRS